MPKKKIKADPLTPLFRTPIDEDSGITVEGVVPRLRDTRKIGPAQAYLDSLGIGAKSMAQVARELKVSVHTMRDLLEVEEINAPSYVADWGKRQIYIYIPEDVTEIRSYLARKRSVAGLRKRKA